MLTLLLTSVNKINDPIQQRQIIDSGINYLSCFKHGVIIFYNNLPPKVKFFNNEFNSIFSNTIRLYLFNMSQYIDLAFSAHLNSPRYRSLFSPPEISDL